MKKGFTLIELLAVIVILAVIALITTLVVIKVIEDVEIGKYKVEEKTLTEAAELYFMSNKMFPYPSEISLTTLVEEGFIKEVVDSGNNGTCEGKVILDENNTLKGCLKCSNYQTEGCGYVKEEPEIIVVDTNPGIICSNSTTEDYDNATTCYIKSIEDLVIFSNLTNLGKDFSGKTVYLEKSLDFNNDESYIDSTTTVYGDINGDGETTSLKDELTTDAGFKPIGTNTSPFKGIFEGNAYAISNLMINRPSTSYIGLFGFNNGTINGLNIENAIVTGGNVIGGLVGYNTGTIKSIVLSSTVIGKNYDSGGLVGYNVGGTINNILIKDTTVTQEKTAAGAIAGYSADSTISGVIENATITASSYYNVFVGNNIRNTIRGIYFKDINCTACSQGTQIEVATKNNLSAYDDFLDTWIGGDNDNDGYYFDYNDNNEIVVKSTKIDKMEFNLNGEGTEEKPYQINNINDWKTATLKVSVSGIYFDLNTDIDFKDKKVYQIGTYNNPFKGIFNGNTHYLKNFTIYGNNYAGIFGNNNGTIKGLNIENSNISGVNAIGGLVGYNTGTIRYIAITSTIMSSNFDSGGLVGYNVGGTINNILIKDTNVTQEKATAGAIAGYSADSTISGVIENATITASSYYNVFVGNNIRNTIRGIYFKDINCTACSQGTQLEVAAKNNLSAYDDFLDTWIGGDNDNDGYYFDYNDNNEIVVKSTKIDKMEFNLNGEGTEENPYQINNINDWKTATLKVSVAGVYFDLNTDIDFKDKKVYQIGTYNNPFKGIFNGNAHYLKNIDICGNNYAGIFGKNNGTIKGLNIENSNISGGNAIGGLVGYNTGSINDITITSTIVSSNYDSGGLVGYNIGGTINNVIVKNTSVTQEKTAAGSIAGYSGNGKISGIVENATITGGYKNIFVGHYYDNNTITGYYFSDINCSGCSQGTKLDVSFKNNINKYNEIVDTWIGGDSDNSGYYFDYNAQGTDIVVVKANSSTTETPTGNVVYTKPIEGAEDATPPTCTLNRYSLVGNGFSASYTCTDNIKLKAKKHIYWATAPENVNYEDLIAWPASSDSTAATVNSVWTVESATNQGITPPQKGACYYFYFGGQDETGNTVIYSSPTCLSY